MAVSLSQSLPIVVFLSLPLFVPPFVFPSPNLSLISCSTLSIYSFPQLFLTIQLSACPPLSSLCCLHKTYQFKTCLYPILIFVWRDLCIMKYLQLITKLSCFAFVSLFSHFFSIHFLSLAVFSPIFTERTFNRLKKRVQLEKKKI